MNRITRRSCSFALGLLLVVGHVAADSRANEMIALVDTALLETALVNRASHHPSAEGGTTSRDMENSISMTQRLTQMANFNRLTGAYRDAEKMYRRLIALQGSDAIDEAALINVYQQLGATYYSLGEYHQSIESLRHALSLIRRVEGVNSVRQLAVLDWLTVSYVQIQEMSQADGQQLLAYHLVLANTGKRNPELLPALMKLADWYLNRGKLNDALFVFEDALTLVENSGMSELEKLAPMRGIATILDRQNGLDSAETALAKQSIQFSLNQSEL